MMAHLICHKPNFKPVQFFDQFWEVWIGGVSSIVASVISIPKLECCANVGNGRETTNSSGWVDVTMGFNRKPRDRHATMRIE